MLILLLLTPTPTPTLAAEPCAVEADAASLAEALASPACSEVRIGSGWVRGRFTVDRDVVVVGAGWDETVLACEGGPCLLVLPGRRVAVRGLSLASKGTSLSVWWAHFEGRDLRVASLGDRGGMVYLKHSEVSLTGVEVDVVQRHRVPVNALSAAGNDLVLDDVTFVGAEPASGTESGVYSIAYGVSCTRCRFVPERTPLVPPEDWLELDESTARTPDGTTGTTRWASLKCGPPTERELAVCEERCDGKRVAGCSLSWEQKTESCVPEARCVDPGEALDE